MYSWYQNSSFWNLSYVDIITHAHADIWSSQNDLEQGETVSNLSIHHSGTMEYYVVIKMFMKLYINMLKYSQKIIEWSSNYRA